MTRITTTSAADREARRTAYITALAKELKPREQAERRPRHAREGA
jgi:hypothetical protein